ncbi:ABC transporter substrate-binding protein [Halothermothrix orenii]|uniref:Extracellular solute-binding protein family 1 n=1 Tax=Halothermothrix orenii (strain H 168 / OCM 544 / DSM 9562) TaxID=373903 RepID=B8CYD6_HALOH|nr:sugar ABC transporter substrate-binding protein [Halothermothrix orenii]ACL70305.1 extracellular solute-binding protein family 1 [Halothermothrix orenii H 168]
MKRSLILTLSVFLVLVLSVSAFAATEITVWYHSGRGGEREVIEDQVKRFNAMQDEVKIKLVQLPEGSYNEQVQAAAMSGDLPDVLDLDGPFIANYAWSGYLRPLEDYVSPELKEDLLPSILAQGTYQGHLYALGTFDSGLAIWGNKEYLEDVGARIPTSVEDAWTFTEFMDILKKLKEHPDVKYPLDFKINYGKGEWFSYGFSPIFQAFGADLINRDNFTTAEGVLNGPEAMAAAWFQALFEQGYANPNPPGDTEFTNGDAALSWCGHWGYNQYKDALGDDVVLIPMPKFATQVTGMGSWAWSITQNCENPEAAWKFIEFILQPEEIVKMTNANGAVPSRLSAAKLSEPYKPGGELRIFVEQLQKIAVERPVTPAYPTITDAFATAIDNIINGGDIRYELNEAVRAIDEEIEFMGLAQ